MASPPPPPPPPLVAQPAARRNGSIPSDREEDGAETFLADPVLILDSGASHHATGDKRLLSKIAAAAPEDRAAVHQTRDGKELPAADSGTVATGKFQLSDVLYVPGLVAGIVLVSVRQLAELGYFVMFGGGRCLVMDRSGGKLIGEGRLQEDGLYRLEFLNIPLDAAADGMDGEVA